MGGISCGVAEEWEMSASLALGRVAGDGPRGAGLAAGQRAARDLRRGEGAGAGLAAGRGGRKFGAGRESLGTPVS